ncbi:MAG: hypothetical protein V9F04_04520 [Dermatophilaceae bacterium]
MLSDGERAIMQQDFEHESDEDRNRHAAWEYEVNHARDRMAIVSAESRALLGCAARGVVQRPNALYIVQADEFESHMAKEILYGTEHWHPDRFVVRSWMDALMEEFPEDGLAVRIEWGTNAPHLVAMEYLIEKLTKGSNLHRPHRFKSDEDVYEFYFREPEPDDF